MEISIVFINPKLFHPDQENERQDIWLSIEKQITSAEHLQTMLDL